MIVVQTLCILITDVTSYPIMKETSYSKLCTLISTTLKSLMTHAKITYDTEQMVSHKGFYGIILRGNHRNIKNALCVISYQGLGHK